MWDEAPSAEVGPGGVPRVPVVTVGEDVDSPRGIGGVSACGRIADPPPRLARIASSGGRASRCRPAVGVLLGCDGGHGHRRAVAGPHAEPADQRSHGRAGNGRRERHGHGQVGDVAGGTSASGGPGSVGSSERSADRATTGVAVASSGPATPADSSAASGAGSGPLARRTVNWPGSDASRWIAASSVGVEPRPISRNSAACPRSGRRSGCDASGRPAARWQVAPSRASRKPPAIDRGRDGCTCVGEGIAGFGNCGRRDSPAGGLGATDRPGRRGGPSAGDGRQRCHRLRRVAAAERETTGLLGGPAGDVDGAPTGAAATEDPASRGGWAVARSSREDPLGCRTLAASGPRSAPSIVTGWSVASPDAMPDGASWWTSCPSGSSASGAG